MAADFAPRNEQERGALRQQYAATRAMVTRWQRDFFRWRPYCSNRRPAEGCILDTFLSNEADVLL